MSYQNVKKSRQRLKERLVYVSGGKCQCCGYDKCIQALEFHHLNPEEKDFAIAANANIGWNTAKAEIQKCILVCANCHREIHAGLVDVGELVNCFNEERATEIDQILYNLKHHKIYYCKNCGIEITQGSQYCINCIGTARQKVERPNREELKNLIRQLPFTTIAKQFSVTDNAIRKWCDSYKLPRTKGKINSYTDEQWELI